MFFQSRRLHKYLFLKTSQHFFKSGDLKTVVKSFNYVDAERYCNFNLLFVAYFYVKSLFIMKMLQFKQISFSDYIN